jgi:hypothetical protein
MTTTLAVVVILGLGWILVGRRRRSRRAGAERASKPFRLAWAIIGAMTILLPAASTYFSWDSLVSNWWTYDACADRGIRVDNPSVTGDGKILDIEYDVTIPAQTNERWWVVLYSLGSTPQVYFANMRLEPNATTTGHHSVNAQLGPKAGAGSERTVYIACANGQGDAGLEEFQQRADDQTFNNHRRGLPPGVRIISKGVDSLSTH